MPGPGQLVGPLLGWFAAHARDLPWRHTRDPYAVWIAEVMLQQTQVATVVPYWERWLRALPDIAALARAPLERVLKLWEGLGYYRRARHLHAAARHIQAELGGTFPHRFETLLALPGVGRYTAGAIASLAFGQPRPVLDGNVARLLSRLAGWHAHPPGPARAHRLWALAEALVRAAPEHVPAVLRRRRTWRARRVVENPCGALNEALMELGATVCTPRQPRCEVCPWAAACVSRARGRIERPPARRPPGAVARRRVWAWVCVHRGRVLLRQRPAGEVNGGLWEFPNVEADGHLSPLEAAQACLGPGVAGIEPWCQECYTITTRRYRLEVFRVELKGSPRRTPAGGRWVTPAELEHLPLAAVHRRVARRWQAVGPG